MKRVALLVLICCSATAAAQDSSFSRLRLRGSVFRNPVAGHIDDDWNAKTGAQIEVATNVGRSELGLAVGHIGYEPTSGKPPFTGTMFTLTWTMPVVEAHRSNLSAGVRLTDLRMDFDDPATVVGLRTEEEVLLGAIARGRFEINNRVALFADGSYGALMLSTTTPMVLIQVGGEVSVRSPEWLRRLLR